MRFLALGRVALFDHFTQNTARPFGITHVDVSTSQVELGSHLRHGGPLATASGFVHGPGGRLFFRHLLANVEVDDLASVIASEALGRSGTRLFRRIRRSHRA